MQGYKLPWDVSVLKTAFLGTMESEPLPLLGAETWQGIWMLSENMLNITFLRKSLSK